MKTLLSALTILTLSFSAFAQKTESTSSNKQNDKKVSVAKKSVEDDKKVDKKSRDHHNHDHALNNVKDISNNSNSPIVIQNCNASEPKTVYKDRVIYKKGKVRYKTKTKVIYKDRPARVKYKTKVVKQRVYVKPKEYNHSLSLLGMASKTRLETTEEDLGGGNQRIQAETEYEADLGVMYQYDHERLRFSIGGSLNGTGFLGAGIKF